MKGTPKKEDRNKKILELRSEMSFRQLGRVFHISGTRVKQIYDKELAKSRKGLDRVA
jgi:DNA-directed RNA polymerase specialized sigma subunit